MHNFQLLKDDNKTLLFNSCFIDKDDIQYAVDHRFNILYTETSCTNTFSYISQFLDLGYTLEVIKHPQYAQGLKLNDKLYAKFIYHDISATENYKYITETNDTNNNNSKKLFDICDNILDIINMALQGNNLNQAKEALILCKNGFELYEQILNKAIETMDKESKMEN